MVPELYLGVDYLFSGFKIGLGAEYVRISPRQLAEVTLPNGETTKVRVNESLNTFNALLYIGYHCQNFNVKANSVFGQSSSHLLNMTGYGVIEEYENGNRAYAPLMSSSSWISLSYNIKKSYQVSLFGGYMKNFGSHSLFTSLDDLYVRGSKNLDQLFRFTPSFVYRPKFGNGFHKLEAGIEYELTGAFYGNASTFYGIPSNVELTMNNRINVILVYNFGN